MTALFVIAVLFVVGVGSLVFALSIARETGRMEERVRKLHEEAKTQAQQGEIMVEPRTPDDAIDRLDSGTF